MASSINLPRILRVGAGASAELVMTLTELGLSRPLLVTDPFMRECGYSDRIQSPLSEAGVACGLFGDCVPDPTTESVYAALEVCRAGDYDCVVALGGGSSLDTAKAVAVLAVHGGVMRDYKVPHQVNSGLPVIAIIGVARRFMMGSSVSNSAVSPELDKASTTSCWVIIPRSP